MDKNRSAVDVLRATLPGAGADKLDPGEALAQMARKLAEAEAREAAAVARAEAAEASRGGGEIRAKVSDTTGVVSVYGVNSVRPVSLYAPQWTKILAGCSCHGSAVERAIKAALSVPGAAERVAQAQREHEAAKAAKAAGRS